MSKAKILFLDDEINILSSLQRVFRNEEDYDLTVCSTPGDALAFLKDSYFNVVVSDQRMPGMDGITFLHKVKEISPDTLRIIMTGYSDIHAVIDSINKGAVYRYLTKPWDENELKISVKNAVFQSHLIHENKELQDTIFEQNMKLKDLNGSLELKVAERTKEIVSLNRKLEDSFLGVVRLMAQLNEMASPLFGNHAKRVTAFSKEIGKTLGLGSKELLELEVAASLHDIGKLGIATDVLLKNDALRTAHEKTVYQSHVLRSEQVAQMIPGLENVALFVRHHHEKFDGTGFPDRLKGKQIPSGARIIAVADGFDYALNSKENFHSVTPMTAMHHIQLLSGTHYDPDVIKAFTAWFNNYTKKSDPLQNEIEIMEKDLLEGMVLSRDLRSSRGLILTKDSVLTEQHIAAILDTHKVDPIIGGIYIYRKKS